MLRLPRHLCYKVIYKNKRVKLKLCEWLQYIKKKLHAKQKVKDPSTRSTVASRGRFIALAVD